MREYNAREAKILMNVISNNGHLTSTGSEITSTSPKKITTSSNKLTFVTKAQSPEGVIGKYLGKFMESLKTPSDPKTNLSNITTKVTLHASPRSFFFSKSLSLTITRTIKDDTRTIEESKTLSTKKLSHSKRQQLKKEIAKAIAVNKLIKGQKHIATTDKMNQLADSIYKANKNSTLKSMVLGGQKKLDLLEKKQINTMATPIKSNSTPDPKNVDTSELKPNEPNISEQRKLAAQQLEVTKIAESVTPGHVQQLKNAKDFLNTAINAISAGNAGWNFFTSGLKVTQGTAKQVYEDKGKEIVTSADKLLETTKQELQNTQKLLQWKVVGNFAAVAAGGAFTAIDGLRSGNYVQAAAGVSFLASPLLAWSAATDAQSAVASTLKNISDFQTQWQQPLESLRTLAEQTASEAWESANFALSLFLRK